MPHEDMQQDMPEKGMPMEKAEQKPTAKQAIPPEVREVVQRIILAAMKVIYSEPKGLLDVIAKAPDQKQGIALASKIVFDKVEQSAKGVPPETLRAIKPGVIQKLGPIVGALLAELAVNAGVIDKAALGESGAAPDEDAGSEAPAPKGLVADEMEA